MTNSQANADFVALRRRRLREWIDANCNGVQAEFISRTGINQGELSGLLNGKKAFGEKKARKLEHDAGMPPGYLDQSADKPLRYRAVATSKDAIDVPLMNAVGSMGIGRPLPENDAVVDHLRLNRLWVRTMFPSLSNPRFLSVIAACGDSMRPTFDDGDLLLVDTGVQDIKIDAVYVLQLGDELFIKRLQRRPDGSYLMISDNKSYEPYLINNEELQNFSVKGRVLFAWNGRRM